MKKATMGMGVGLLLLLAISMPSAMATHALNVSTSQTAYNIGERLSLSGSVAPVEAGFDVTIVVMDPSGKRVAQDQATPTAAGSFSATNIMTFTQGDPEGLWSVRVTYRDASSTATFRVRGTAGAAAAGAAQMVHVTVLGPTVAAPGETVVIFVELKYNGTLVNGEIIGPHVWKPTTPATRDSLAAPNRFATGHYQLSYRVPADLKGTYWIHVIGRSNGTSNTGSASFKVMDSPASSAEVAALSRDLAAARAALDTRIGAAQTAVTTAITNSQNAVTGAISGSQTAVTGALTAARTAVDATITGARTALSGDIGRAVTAADNARTAAERASTTGNTVSTAVTQARGDIAQVTTFVLVVAVLTLITLVLELVVVVRKRA